MYFAGYDPTARVAVVGEQRDGGGDEAADQRERVGLRDDAAVPGGGGRHGVLRGQRRGARDAVVVEQRDGDDDADQRERVGRRAVARRPDGGGQRRCTSRATTGCTGRSCGRATGRRRGRRWWRTSTGRRAADVDQPDGGGRDAVLHGVHDDGRVPGVAEQRDGAGTVQDTSLSSGTTVAPGDLTAMGTTLVFNAPWRDAVGTVTTFRPSEDRAIAADRPISAYPCDLVGLDPVSCNRDRLGRFSRPG